MMKEIVVLILDRIVYQLDVADTKREVKKFSSHDLVHDTLFITYQSDELTNILEDQTHFASILDLECLDIQIRQSLGLEMPEGKWSIVNMFHAYLGLKQSRWVEDEYEEILRNIASCYLLMKERGASEWKRIEDIEIPVNKVLYDTQRQGIYINHADIEPLCQDLHRKIYGIKNQIQLEYGFVGDRIEDYLALKEIFRGELTRSVEHKLEKDHPEIALFKKLRRTKQNFNCLIMLSAIREDVNICKPVFKGFGSTTGRIILRDPALQNLNQNYRYLLKNEALPFNTHYVYIDYGQFEAGVLAGLSGNKQFRTLYEQDKVYEELARKTKTDRETAKMYFYSFVYGGIVWKGAEIFFKTYGLQRVVDGLTDEALKNGYVETALGNRRVCSSSDDKKWILNHRIQGTASLIFKQALIDVYKLFPSKVKLVLPMHDAALYIADDDVRSETLIDVFKEAFTKWLPGVKPIVKEKEFFPGPQDEIHHQIKE